MDYKEKYLKYKAKYLKLKKQIGGVMQITENRLLAVDSTNPYILHVEKSVALHFMNFIGRGGKYQNILIGEVARDGNLLVKSAGIIREPDCLHLAEGVVAKNLNYRDDPSMLTFYNGRDFGLSDALNISGSLDPSNYVKGFDDSAVPNEDEVYAIVGNKIKAGVSPYHIAYVIARDGNHAVTFEIFSGPPGYNPPGTPYFGIYSVVPGDVYPTFHARWRSYYESNHIVPKTIILRRKH